MLYVYQSFAAEEMDGTLVKTGSSPCQRGSRVRDTKPPSLGNAFVTAVLTLSALWLCGGCGDPHEVPVQRKVQLVVSDYNPRHGDSPTNRICQEMMRDDPDVAILPWNPLSIEGAKGNSQKLMAYAGETAPDVVFTHWHEIQTDIRQNFLCPLNEYIGYDGYYGVDPKTDKPTGQTGKPKLRKDPQTGATVLDQNGKIDDDEALWPEWRTYPQLNRFVVTAPGRLARGPDGKPYDGPVIYGVPVGQPGYWGIIYRRDLFRKAGFGVGEVPATWEEFWYFCQRLTEPRRDVPGSKFHRGQRGFALPLSGWLWIQWLWSAGGNFIMQAKTNPHTGKVHWFPKEEVDFIDPDTQEPLGREPSTWTATFASQAGKRAVDFYHKLCWQRWIRHPQTGEPIDLTRSAVEQGWTVDPRTKERVEFTADDVIAGAVRQMVTQEDNWVDMFQRGEVAMVMGCITQLQGFKVPPNNLGFFPTPAGPDGTTIVGYFRHNRALNSTLAGPDRKAARDKAWKLLSRICGPRGRELAIRDTVLQGYAGFMTPKALREAGMEEYIDQIPKHWRDNYEKVMANARSEPFMGYFYPVDAQLNRKVFGFLASDEGFDYTAALDKLQDEANERIMFGLPEEFKAARRPWALVGVIIAAILFALGIRFIVRAYRGKEDTEAAGLDRRASARGVHLRWLPWLLLAPALVSIVLWAYYPLVRGSVMAFQDYRIVGDSSWVGLDNFIEIFCTEDFWKSLLRTFRFAGLTLGLCFFTPIILAILLSEVPKGKTFYRTVFFLPQVSSGLVVLFIWKLMYNPTEYGLLNQILLGMNAIPLGVAVLMKIALLGLVGLVVYALSRIALTQEHETRKGRAFFVALAVGSLALLAWLVPTMAPWQRFEMTHQNWLGDARWAMIACILPGMWAQAGIGSLIYLAALKNVDDEVYEAAEIDGCGFFEKMWHITIPYLKPLIIINFIGAFIGTFHSMGNIFAMTGGGPGDETTVLSLDIWYQAFAFLKFGIATAMAWVLGLLLIGFTVYQLRILKKVEFRRAENF